MAYYTLSDVVNEKLAELGEGQMNKFARFYQFAVSGLRKFNLNTSGVPKVVELTIDSNDTAALPADYVKYTKIALCTGGRLYALGLDNSICLNPQYNDCGEEIAHSDASFAWNGYLGNPLLADNFRNGELMGRVFGIGGDNNVLGYYRIDEAHNRIVFKDLMSTSTLVMEYLADINAVDGDFVVHPYCVEALKDWIMWKYKENSSKAAWEQQFAKQNFMESSRLMRRMFTSSNINEWIQTFNSGNIAAPKM